MSDLYKNIFETYESNVRSYCRCFPSVFKKAKGSIITDVDGKEYIDFWCGAGAVNYGHNNPYIKEKLINYLEEDGIIHSLDMMTEPKALFIEAFENDILKPRNLDYKIMFPGPTGTNGVEAALKLARKVKKRCQIWALMGAFHGMTLGSVSLTSDFDSRKGAGVPLQFVTHIPAPYMVDFDTIDYMRLLLTDDHSAAEKPAAIIIETIQAEGGIWALDVDYLKRLRAFCDEFDILLIVDDIQVGCLRSGTFFSFERADIVPDMVVLSKSIGGYGLPFALTLMKPGIDVFNPGEHNGTFRGNQLSMVAAKAAIEFIKDNNLEAETKRKEAIMRDYLTSNIKNHEVRGIGLIWGVDMGDGKKCARVTDTCFANGLIVEKAGRDNRVVKLMPALTIPDDELLKGLKILCDAVNE